MTLKAREEEEEDFYVPMNQILNCIIKQTIRFFKIQQHATNQNYIQKISSNSTFNITTVALYFPSLSKKFRCKGNK